MATLRLDIVTAERMVYSDEVNMVIANGIDGQLGILPHHSPLMTMLQPGELILRKDKEEIAMAISGGFLEVRPDKVVILADAAEHVDEIDAARAEEAKRRAEERIKEHLAEVDLARAEIALKRSLARLKVLEKRRRRSEGRSIG